MLLMAIFTREETVGREPSNAFSVVDLGILGGIVLTLYSLAPVLVEESRV